MGQNYLFQTISSKPKKEIPKKHRESESCLLIPKKIKSAVPQCESMPTRSP